jgi:hypothetical protein
VERARIPTSAPANGKEYGMVTLYHRTTEGVARHIVADGFHALMIEGVSLPPPPISGIAIERRTPPPRHQIA